MFNKLKLVLKDLRKSKKIKSIFIGNTVKKRLLALIFHSQEKVANLFTHL